MKVLLICCICTIFSFAQNIGLSCIELYKLNIVFDKKNTPVMFKFTHSGKMMSDSIETLFPILKAIDYDGLVQFKSKKGIVSHHISYADPGEENSKKPSSDYIIKINQLNEKSDSVTYGDMWGGDNLFSQRFLYIEKIQEVRFLLPLFKEINNLYTPVGYVCSNWHKLHEVENPAKCYENKKKSNQQVKTDTAKKHLGMPSKKFLEDIGLLLECE